MDQGFCNQVHRKAKSRHCINEGIQLHDALPNDHQSFIILDFVDCCAATTCARTYGQKDLWALLDLLSCMGLRWSLRGRWPREIPPRNPWEVQCSTSLDLSCTCINWEGDSFRLLRWLCQQVLASMVGSRMGCPTQTYLLSIADSNLRLNSCWVHHESRCLIASGETWGTSWVLPQEHFACGWFRYC